MAAPPKIRIIVRADARTERRARTVGRIGAVVGHAAADFHVHLNNLSAQKIAFGRRHFLHGTIDARLIARDLRLHDETLFHRTPLTGRHMIAHQLAFGAVHVSPLKEALLKRHERPQTGTLLDTHFFPEKNVGREKIGTLGHADLRHALKDNDASDIPRPRRLGADTRRRESRSGTQSESFDGMLHE